MMKKKDAWRELAEEIDGEFIERSAFKGGDYVKKTYKSWRIYLDTYTVSTGKSSVTFTRIRAPYAGEFDFRMKLGRSNVFTKLARFLGKQYALTGDDVFDEKFYIKAYDEYIVKKIFANKQLKDTLSKIKHLSITVKKARGKDIYDEYIIEYQVTGVIKDKQMLKNVFAVFEMLLDEFVETNIANEDKPQVVLFRDKNKIDL